MSHLLAFLTTLSFVLPTTNVDGEVLPADWILRGIAYYSYDDSVIGMVTGNPGSPQSIEVERRCGGFYVRAQYTTGAELMSAPTDIVFKPCGCFNSCHAD